MEARPWADGKTVTYRYHPLGEKPINLGTNRDEAIRKVLDLTGEAPGQGTMTWVWEHWLKHPKTKKLSEGTRADYALAWKQIEKVFGSRQASSIQSTEVAHYVHVTRAGSPRRADVEKTVLSNLFKLGVILGVCSTNPTVSVVPHGSEASDVMPETAALVAFMKWLDAGTPQRRVLACAAEYAELAGNRQAEFRELTTLQVDRAAGEIRVKRAKQRGKKRGEVVEVIAITPRMKALLDKIEALRAELGRQKSLYLFPTIDGGMYSARGFKTLFQRAITDAIAAGVLTRGQRFNFHSLRRYYATMHKAATGSLPNLHADPRVTARVYDATKEERRRAL
jgi:integrase